MIYNDYTGLDKCPFCGGAAYMMGRDGDDPYYFVRCGECGADTRGAETVDQAKANWNMRCDCDHDEFVPKKDMTTADIVRKMDDDALAILLSLVETKTEHKGESGWLEWLRREFEYDGNLSA